MRTSLRDVAQGLADCIANDRVLHDDGNVTVVVEDKGNFQFQIEEALGQTGVCVTIAVTGFRRVERSPILQGTLELQISCFEHPALNRDDESVLTAQGVAERLVELLHYRRFPFLANQMIFKDFRREDLDEANIVRCNFEANTLLGYGRACADKTTINTQNAADAAEGE